MYFNSEIAHENIGSLISLLQNGSGYHVHGSYPLFKSTISSFFRCLLMLREKKSLFMFILETTKAVKF